MRGYINRIREEKNEMLGHTNCRALTTVKCLCNNHIIILKVREAVCIFSKSLGEAKNKTGGMIITVRKW